MSIADLFDSGFKKRNEDHFAAIVKVAMADGEIHPEEQEFLDRLARRLDIRDDEYKQILKDYATHPVNPPSSYDRRIERLYDLARMVWADHIEGEAQVNMLDKLCIGLGFRTENAKYVRQKALDMVHEGVDIDEFTEGIKNMNK